MKDIIRLKKKYDTDKSSLYLKNYQKYFSKLQNKKIDLLELGILEGESLLLWEEYFPRANIVGVDINTVSLRKKSTRIKIFEGKQQDINFLDQVALESTKKGFDIIIDDASHVGELTKISFWHLFENYLKPGGVYIIEDWRTGYWSKYPDGKDYDISNLNTYFRNYIRNAITNLRKISNLIPNIFLARRVSRLLELSYRLTYQKRFHSHDYGMVGFVKELIDELGMDMITDPDRGSKVPRKLPKFKSVEFFPGQVFIVKASKLKYK